MTRYDDCGELLHTVEKVIFELSQEYGLARANDEVLHVSRVQVKSCLENIRSVFEYVAMDIYESYSKKETRVYFPYGADEHGFTRSVAKNLPGLSVQAPELYGHVERVQPHRCGDGWLVELCKATNFNKHNRLSKQVRKNSEKSTFQLSNIIHAEGVDTIVMEDITYNGRPVIKGKLVVDKDSRLSDIKSQVHEGFAVDRRFDWVEFSLEDIQYDIQKLLIKAHSEARALSDDVRAVIG